MAQAVIMYQCEVTVKTVTSRNNFQGVPMRMIFLKRSMWQEAAATANITH